MFNKVKNWDEFKENKQIFLPLDSLKWEFWNQSGTKFDNSILLNKKYDSEMEFKNHIDLYIDSIEYISKTNDISKEKVISNLKKFWDESIESNYIDMRVNKRRFIEFSNMKNNENKSYIANEILHYVLDEEYFKNNGYIYQELFASDIPYYHKEVGERKIWCRVEDKMVFIADWYDFLTPTILNYFVKYRDSKDVKHSKTFDFHYLKLRLNRETGEIVNSTLEITMNDDNIYNNWPWCELVLPIEETDKILNEINKLTNNKFK